MPLKDGSFGTEYSLGELRITASRAPMDDHHRALMEWAAERLQQQEEDYAQMVSAAAWWKEQAEERDRTIAALQADLDERRHLDRYGFIGEGVDDDP